MNNKPNITAIYVRVSTSEQVKEGYSIEEQIDRLKSYCKALKWSETKLYIDAGYSGGNMNRPALMELLRDVRGNKIKRVVVYKLDRLSRSQKDTLILIEDEFLGHDCDFVSMSENFDTSSPFGRAMVGILAVFAQLERDQIKERMSMGREARAKDGKWVGVGNVPIGYDYKDGLLTINDYEAMQIRELFDLYISGNSPRAIARIFDDKGYKTRYGKWYEKRIVTTLNNKLYIGQVEFNKTYYDGIHEPIISEAVFEEAQKEQNFRKRTIIPKAREFTLLGGLLFCRRCGARYGIYGSGKYKYYACHSRRKRNAAMIKDPDCKNKTYNLNYLDNLILNEIRQLSLNPDRMVREVSEDNSPKADLLLSEIDKLNKQRKRYLELYGSGDFTSEELHEYVAPLQDQIDKLQVEVGKLSEKADLSVSEAKRIIRDFNDIVDNANHEQLRRVVLALIKKIEIDGENIIIYWRFQSKKTSMG